MTTRQPVLAFVGDRVMPASGRTVGACGLYSAYRTHADRFWHPYYERKVLPDIGSAWIQTPPRFVWRHLRRHNARMKEIDHGQTTAYINPAAGQRLSDLLVEEISNDSRHDEKQRRRPLRAAELTLFDRNSKKSLQENTMTVWPLSAISVQSASVAL